MSQQDDDQRKAALRAQALMQTSAVHSILDGLELVCDARFVAAAYVTRAARIMATLRVRGLTERNEIDAVAEHFLLMAMDDKNAGAAHDNDGLEIISPADKQRLN